MTNLFDPEIVAPMRVTSVEQKFDPRDNEPLWLYTIEFDHTQGQRMMKELKANAPDLHPQVLMFDTITISTKTPLVLGVGDLYTPNLVTFDELPETDEERELNEKRATLMNLLTGQAGFMVVRDDDEE